MNPEGWQAREFNSSPLLAYTARQIADTLREEIQSIRRRLPPPPAVKFENGRETDAWSFASLPSALQSELEGIATANGYRNALAMLSDPAPSPRWQPRCPISECSQDAIDTASKRRRFFIPFLEADGEGLTERGPDAYQKEFGHKISLKWLRTLFDRIVHRDGGAGEWTRLELYLDDNAAAAKTAPSEKYDFSALAYRLEFKNPSAPTSSERQNALEYSFIHCRDWTISKPGQAAQIKAAITNFLYSAAPCLAKTAKALHRNWNRLYFRWLENGQTPEAIVDGRTRKASGEHLKELEADLQLIVSEAYQHDGDISLAIRKLRRDDKLTQAYLDRYSFDGRRYKSYVPASIRKEVDSRLTGMLEYRRSPHQARMAGPRIQRDHSAYQPGDYFAADDVTWNAPFWFIDDNGLPSVTNGECLLFFDCRSLYALGFVLVPGHYSSETIRRGCSHNHDIHGLPHMGYVFERGPWGSKLLVGNNPRDFLGWSDWELGLREKGLSVDIRNVTTPGAKLIEQCFNIMQQDQRNVQGFLGFIQRFYRQEELQKFKDQARRGMYHPSEKFLSMDESVAMLSRRIELYNAEPQNGRLLRGKSPAEMFATHAPLRKLADNERFLIASHRVRTRVKPNGISITIRGQRRFYYNPELGKHLGRDVLAFYNTECPDLLTVCDLDMKNPVSVRRNLVPFAASKDELKPAIQAQRGFAKAAKLRVDEIKHPVRRSITRDNLIGDEAQSVGRHILAETKRFEAEKSEGERLQRRVARLAEESGIAMPMDVRNPKIMERALQRMKESQALYEAEEKEKNHE